MNRTLHLLLFLLMLVGCRTVAPSEKHVTSDHPTLTVVTLNLYHDKDDWPRRRVQILETLKALQPEVIALQEVLQHETLPNQAEWLATQLGYDWHFVSVDPPGKARRYGNALLTRLPVLARDQQALQPLQDSRTVGMLRVELEGKPINVYVTHLHHTGQGGAMRAQQLDDAMAFITSTAGGFPSIVAGDFNAAADAPELTALRTGFVDTYGILHPGTGARESSTLNPHYFTPARIDHVFHQRDAFRPMTARIILDHPDAQGTWPSDHYGLQVELQLTAANGSVGNPP
jgi:beta-glucosidase